MTADVNDPLPVISLALYPMSYITRLTKSSMLEVLGQDYVRTARAKGVTDFMVVLKHTLRNALIPAIHHVGPMIAYILTGSMVVETVFNIGGLGTKFVSAINNQDYPTQNGHDDIPGNANGNDDAAVRHSVQDRRSQDQL